MLNAVCHIFEIHIYSTLPSLQKNCSLTDTSANLSACEGFSEFQQKSLTLVMLARHRIPLHFSKACITCLAKGEWRPATPSETYSPAHSQKNVGIKQGRYFLRFIAQKREECVRDYSIKLLSRFWSSWSALAFFCSLAKEMPFSKIVSAALTSSVSR